MIPDTRPVLGKDLDTIRQQYGILTADACWLFGLSMTRWMQIVRQAPEVPVKDPSLALLVRLLDMNPDLSVIPKFPTAAEMFQFLSNVQQTDQKRVAAMFGSEASATYRWLKLGSRQTPAVSRLMHYLKASMMAKSPDGRPEILEQWGRVVKSEADARGARDVFKTGRWNVKGVAEQSAAILASTPESEKLVRKKGLAAKGAAAKKAKTLASSKA